MSVSFLAVDDEVDVADMFRQHFRREVRQGQYVLHFARSAEEALDSRPLRSPFGCRREGECSAQDEQDQAQ